MRFKALLSHFFATEMEVAGLQGSFSVRRV